MKKLDNLLEKNNVIGYSEEKEYIEVFVTEKLPMDKLQELIEDINNAWTQEDIIPEKYKGWFSSKPYKVSEIGVVQTENSKKYRPIKMGCEINPEKTMFVGTAGGMVYKPYYGTLELTGKWASFKRLLDLWDIPYDKKYYLITNTHVTHPLSVEDPQESVVLRQPYKGDDIGHTVYSVPYKPGQKNYVDASLIELTKDFMDVTINGVTPEGINTTPVKGLKLWKYGRTTDYKEGFITNVGATAYVNHNGTQYLFKDLIFASSMSAGGDSGSFVYDTNNNVVGLLFAGSPTTTMIIPISTVLKELGVEI